MILSPDQIEKIAEILNHRVSVFVGKSYGQDFLSSEQKRQLERMGVDLEKMYKLHTDPLFLQYQLGMMSGILSKLELNRYSFPEFIQSVRRGEYLPLTEREQATLNSVKMQSFADIRSFQGQIFADVNNIVNKSSTNYLNAQRKAIKKKMADGLAKRKSYKEIAQDLGNFTGDWARRWDRIVQYQGHLAFQEGKAAIMERKQADPLVYKNVYEGACKHCIRMYLTGPIGSEPKVFKLSELRANGTNIGKKVADWLPVVGPVHPFCRCNLSHLEEGKEWDAENKQFVYKKQLEPKVKRSKVPLYIGEKEYMV